MGKFTLFAAIFILIAGLGVGVLLIRYPQVLNPGAKEEITSLSYQPHPNGDVVANGVSQNPQAAIQQMLNASRQDPNILSLYLSEFSGAQILAANYIDDTARAQAANQLEEILVNSTVALVPIEEDTITYIAMDADGNPYETAVQTSSLENATQLIFDTSDGNQIAIINDCGNIRVKVGCNERCDFVSGSYRYECIESLTCHRTNGLSYCRNPNCIDQTDCVCSTPTPTRRPTRTPTPTSTGCPLPAKVEGVEVVCPEF